MRFLRLRRIVAVMALLLAPLFAARPVSAEMSGSFRALLSVYRCEVVHRLEQIYAAGNPASHRDRFIAVTVPGRLQAYVQCIFYDHETKIHCEAASGFYYDKEGELRTFYQPPETIAALARLGFDTDDSKGNFSTEFDVSDPPDFNAIADFILKSAPRRFRRARLYEFTVQRPFAPRAPSTCVPVS